MPRHDRKTAKATVAVLAVAALTAALGGRTRLANATDVPLAIIVSESSPLTNISKSALRRGFLSEPTVIAGVKLLPLNQNPGTPDRIRFDIVVLDLTAVTFVCSTFANFVAHVHTAVPDASLLLHNPSRMARLVLTTTGLDTIRTGRDDTAPVEFRIRRPGERPG